MSKRPQSKLDTMDIVPLNAKRGNLAARAKGRGAESVFHNSARSDSAATADMEADAVTNTLHAAEAGAHLDPMEYGEAGSSIHTAEPHGEEVRGSLFPTGSARIKKPPFKRPETAASTAGPSGAKAVLQTQASIDKDEMYGESEKALSEFLKLHPMLSERHATLEPAHARPRLRTTPPPSPHLPPPSTPTIGSCCAHAQLDTTTHRTLQLVSDLVGDSAIKVKELEVVSKSYEDAFLAPANTSIGERSCCLDGRCICVWLARWRYGDDTKFAFRGKEFLLPSQLEQFRNGGALPPTPGKCLVCTRYFTTFLYRCARSDPTFAPSADVPLQYYSNCMGVGRGEDYPTHASVAMGADGYRAEALLFADEGWANTTAARTSMAPFLWRPVVRFCSADYEYVTDDSGSPRMLQQRIGAASTPLDPNFRTSPRV